MNPIYKLRHKIQILKDFLQLLSTGPVTMCPTDSMFNWSSLYQLNKNAVCRKRVFSSCCFNNLRNSPWTALITRANFSLETKVHDQNHKEVF